MHSTENALYTISFSHDSNPKINRMSTFGKPQEAMPTYSLATNNPEFADKVATQNACSYCKKMPENTSPTTATVVDLHNEPILSTNPVIHHHYEWIDNWFAKTN